MLIIRFFSFNLIIYYSHQNCRLYILGTFHPLVSKVILCVESCTFSSTLYFWLFARLFTNTCQFVVLFLWKRGRSKRLQCAILSQQGSDSVRTGYIGMFANLDLCIIFAKPSESYLVSAQG